MKKIVYYFNDKLCEKDYNYKICYQCKKVILNAKEIYAKNSIYFTCYFK